MIIAIEIDNIISTPVSNFMALQDVSKCQLLCGAIESLTKMKELGHSILIYTRRDASLGQETEVWLQKNKVPYDRITFNKPLMDLSIDSISYKFDNWVNFFEINKYKLNNSR